MITSYDAENDILALHEGFGDDAFKGNIDAGDLILDISTTGKVRGVEVMNATRFFSDFSEDMLRNISEARLDSQSSTHGITLRIVLKAEGQEVATKVVVVEAK